MASASEKLTLVRDFLAQRCPRVPVSLGSATSTRCGRILPTGIGSLDTVAGGLPAGALTEIVCAAPSCGGHLLLGQLLAVTRATRIRVALVDSTNAFDPGSFPADALLHLVWVRCPGTEAALGATDLLARDANLGLVVLDLRRAPEAELRRISSPQWYRLQRAVESSDLALLVETPRPSVPNAQMRFTLGTAHSAASATSPRDALLETLAPTLQRQRLHTAFAG